MAKKKAEPKLRRYRATPIAFASGKPKFIEAASLEEAQKKADAEDYGLGSLCHHCAGHVELGDIDRIDVELDE